MKDSDYQWCHGPRCHERKTTNRVRGVKGSKVLRTRKIPFSSHCSQYYRPYVYFCDQTCLMDFIKKYVDEFVQLHPRTEALETPIVIETSTRTDYYGYDYSTKEIKRVDND